MKVSVKLWRTVWSIRRICKAGFTPYHKDVSKCICCIPCDDREKI